MPPQNFNAGQQAQQQATMAQQQALRAQQQAQQQAVLAQQQAILAQQRHRVAAQRTSPSSQRPSKHAAREAPFQDLRLVLATARDALEKREWTESANAFERLLSDPRYAAEARYGLGWIELQQGSRDRAEGLFREAIQYDPGHANAWFALGRVTEESSVDEAIRCYRRALAANPEHYSASERLRLLDEPEAPAGVSSLHESMFMPTADRARMTVQPASDADGSSRGIAGLADPGGLGIVEYLQRDNSELARDALARIEALNRSSRFRFTAHLQSVVTRFALMVVPAVILAYILYHITPLTIGHTTVHFYSNNSTQLILAAVAVWGVWTTWTLLDCATNTVTIRNARIRWTHGVLNKRTETLDVWTARDVELDRDLVQRLTGDGTLTFKGTTHDRARRLHKGQFKPLRLIGVARADELEGIYALLLDLKFLLRAHPGLKGIIQ